MNERDEINRLSSTPNPEQMHHSHRRVSRATLETAAQWAAHVEACAPCAEWEVETAKANLAKRLTPAAEKRLAKAVARLAKAAR